MMHREEQLRDTIAVFERLGFKTWLDAGSLLGAIREGGLLSWDKDIDFSCWADQLAALRRVTTTLYDAGYTVLPQQYKGLLHKIQFRPPLTQLLRGVRTIDVSIFRRQESMAWCPVNCVEPQPKPRFSLRWFLEKPVRETFIKPWERQIDRRPLRIPFPRLTLEVRTWVVPSRLFLALDTTSVDGVRVPVPLHAQEYLSFRYGDWRTPVTSWDYCQDDRALVPSAPELAVPDWRPSR